MKLVTYRVREDCTDRRGRLRLSGELVELPAGAAVPPLFEKLSERREDPAEREALAEAEKAERRRLLSRLKELGAPRPPAAASLPELRGSLELFEISLRGEG